MFDGRQENFASCRQEAEFRLLVIHLPLNRRVPALALATDKMPRELCLSLGVDVLKSDDGVGKIMEALHKNLAPDASGAAFRCIILFFGLHRPHLTSDEHQSRFEMARRRAEARLPNGGIFPDILLPSFCLRNAGLAPNQKSTILSSTGGDPSLEAMKRHMRRILQPCGMEMQQDAPLVSNDLLKAHQNLPGSDANKALRDETPIGDAQVAPKEKKKKKKRGKSGLSPAPSENGATPHQVNPRAGSRNAICFRNARGRNRMLRDGCLLRW